MPLLCFVFKAAVTSPRIYQPPSGVIYFFLLFLLYSLRISLALHEYTCFTLLAPSFGRILKLLYLVSIVQRTRPSAGNLFCFPESDTSHCGDFSFASRP